MIKITDVEFDRILAEILDESPASTLLSVPGVYEVVSEHFNNDVLRCWEHAHRKTPIPQQKSPNALGRSW